MDWGVSTEEEPTEFIGVYWVARLFTEIPKLPIFLKEDFFNYCPTKMDVGSIHCALAVFFKMLDMNNYLVNLFFEFAPEEQNNTSSAITGLIEINGIFQTNKNIM